MVKYELVPVLNWCDGCERDNCNDIRNCKKSMQLCNICDVGIDNCGNQHENCTEKYQGMPQVFIEMEE